MSQEAKILSASAVSRSLGMSVNALLGLYRSGVIDAEVHEGRLIRFDLEKVRKILAKRAKQHRTTTQTPSGMVPTF